jgi:hypothetical protein
MMTSQWAPRPVNDPRGGREGAPHAARRRHIPAPAGAPATEAPRTLIAALRLISRRSQPIGGRPRRGIRDQDLPAVVNAPTFASRRRGLGSWTRSDVSHPEARLPSGSVTANASP